MISAQYAQAFARYNRWQNASLMAAACGGTTSVDAPITSSTQKAGTLRVPADFPTIQDAVDAAKPGSLILIAPGVYNEGVTVETEDLTIRGEDRNTVILDGGDRGPGRLAGDGGLAAGVPLVEALDSVAGATGVDALVPFVEHQELMTDWDARRGIYQLEPLQDFVPEVNRRLAQKALAAKTPQNQLPATVKTEVVLVTKDSK